MTLTLGIRIPPAQKNPLEMADLAREVESAGFETAWVTDTPLIGGRWGDPFVYLTAMAMRTEKLKLGVAVTTPIMRHLRASGAACGSLYDIVGGRFILGIGAGRSAAGKLGLKHNPLETLREYATALRTLFREGKVDYQGKRIEFHPTRPIPIYMAAQGPKSIELAGEIADGVILQVGTNRKTIAWAIERLRKGAEKAGRDFGEIFVMMSVHCCALEDHDKAISRARHLMAAFHFLSRHILDIADLPRNNPPKDFDIYPDLSHAYDLDKAARISSFISDEVVESLCLVGPPERWVEKLHMIEEFGVRHVLLRGPESYNPPMDEIAFCRDEIIPRWNARNIKVALDENEDCSG
ncbi:MAG: LLM class flavin-dependent oxidoreductase [Nitrospinota bacterium]|jgi:5,10-methylenetetrahydromethanopterin reductase|nr:LLM class flavin-dependent oxidoreductase [Nitrospinota bacterium]MDP7169287.1 LLM class flavin-dependent oxidoreductase [Nitrospinota bacterium]MDP7371959.1 LLM class flavin-dependent oxidoreductase [Nitrospinota bacterium]MDP7663847.1 LLM class flavin-dependent oxidoreductase [Nitrospinota bacterium]